ncbi:MAG: DUF3795 domain-containing protein [Desulfarculus sp.]|nr:DUF3795 domain-containing protein [Desulfarculus sp.]
MDEKLLAPCGLFCGVCAVYQATQNGDQRLKERLLEAYRGQLPGGGAMTMEDINCQGCLSGQTFAYCRHCPVRACTRDQGLEGCHQCPRFPCLFIDSFPQPLGKKTILRAVPRWRELPTGQWIQEEIRRYQCPRCGRQLFRGARRCPDCREPVDLD